MNDIGPLYVGRSLLRREDHRLLKGQGQFIADLVLPRMLHAVLVRSPVAHARIRSVDLSRAAAAPVAALALSGADLLQLLPPVPEGQISLPRKWTSVIQHKFVNPRRVSLRNCLRSRGLRIYRRKPNRDPAPRIPMVTLLRH